MLNNEQIAEIKKIDHHIKKMSKDIEEYNLRSELKEILKGHIRILQYEKKKTEGYAPYSFVLQSTINV